MGVRLSGQLERATAIAQYGIGAGGQQPGGRAHRAGSGRRRLLHQAARRGPAHRADPGDARGAEGRSSPLRRDLNRTSVKAPFALDTYLAGVAGRVEAELRGAAEESAVLMP